MAIHFFLDGHLFFLANLLIDLLEEHLPDLTLKIFIVHELGGDFFVLFHPVYEETFQGFQKDIVKPFHAANSGSLS